MIRLAIADDHALIREGLNKIISYEKDLKIIAEGDSGEELLELLEEQLPDIAILDINMENLDGVETLKIIRQKWPKVKVIMLTVEKQKRRIRETLELGADGYVLKESAGNEITNAIRSVYLGGKYIDNSLFDQFFIEEKSENTNNYLEQLTKRELSILVFISDGLKNKEIAEKLFLSEKTIKNYVTNIFRKINVDDRVHATIFALNNKVKQYYIHKYSDSNISQD